MFDMDFNDHNNGMSVTTDARRPPHFNTSNIGSGYGQVFGGDESDGDSSACHRQYAQALLERIVREHAMEVDDMYSDDGSSSDGDEGLDDHLREQHDQGADVGLFRTGDFKRHMAHNYLCECPICPHRISASVNEWLNAAIDPETPGSMYVEQGSGEISMSSSMFFETRPQTPAQLAEMGSWSIDNAASTPHHEEHNYIPSPLRLLPERMVPHQLDTCIPEESEPESDYDFW